MNTTLAPARQGIRRWAAATAMALSLGMGPGLATTAEAQWTLAATPMGETGGGAIVATVEWSPITKGAVARVYQQRLAMYTRVGGPGTNLCSLKLLGLERAALQQLIDREIALREARRLQLDVTLAEVRARLAAMPALQENGRYIGEARALELLARHQPWLPREAVLEEFRRDLVRERLEDHVTRGIPARERCRCTRPSSHGRAAWRASRCIPRSCRRSSARRASWSWR